MTAAAGLITRKKTEAISAAVVRAMTGVATIRFEEQQLHNGRYALPVQAPHLAFSLESNDFCLMRGAMDSVALREQHSDLEMHRALRPSHPVERLIFELLEQLRVETLAPEQMLGVKHNLLAQFQRWSYAYHRSGATESALGLLFFTVCQICWSRITGEPVLHETEDLIEATRAGLAAVLGNDTASLRRCRFDQAAYAVHARSIAQLVAGMVNEAVDEAGRTGVAKAKKNQRNTFTMLLDFDSDEGEEFSGATNYDSRTGPWTEGGYRIFATDHDIVVPAHTLVRQTLLRELRTLLDAKVSEHNFNLPRLVRMLSAALAVPKTDGWEDGQETGHIDGRRLSQLITSPSERHLFRILHTKPHVDCVLSILVDCSGSMKSHNEPLTIVIDVLARALEMAGVTTEILGFTTRAWHGGRACKEWERQNRPAKPGRLNELCHMIFKDADTPWRQGRRDIAAFLKTDLFREGVDGEAVQWACKRLQLRTEARRILLVISDGSTADGATSLANDPLYLQRHLKAVVQHHETTQDVEICGVGIGIDLSAVYTRSLIVDLTEALSTPLFYDLVRLVTSGRRCARTP